MREKIDYRNNIEQLNLRFPDKDMLNITDVAKFMGKDRHWVSETYAKEFKVCGKCKLMSKATLARLVS